MPKKILIADDDPEMLTLLHLALQPLGVDIREVHNAMGALTAIHEDHHDLAVLDIHMPGGNGLSACEMLASDPAFAQLAIIVLTGQADDGTQHRCQRLGAHFVRKGPEAVERVKRLVCGLLCLGDWRVPAVAPLFVG
ncbi:MAG TPA: response regulator [Tepidisphaeraceae bacterium]|nr:response regulator [Tepidisphaeraceae bacterium]